MRPMIPWRMVVFCVCLLSAAAGLRASPLDSWTVQYMGLNNDLFGVAFGKGTFVAVGTNGLILTSANGLDWTPRSSGTTNDLNGVAFGNGSFVAVGNVGTILTSSDG